jgi:hypothetical protein
VSRERLGVRPSLPLSGGEPGAVKKETWMDRMDRILKN